MEMKKPNLHNAEFLRSAVKESDFPHDPLPQIVFAGKSNVGKSSVINKLLNRKNFARVSAQPGKTIHINYFTIDKAMYLVDLPGYGYARVSKAEQQRWGALMETYFAMDLLTLGIQIVDIHVMIPPNVKHWHGAKKDSWFSHIAIEVPGENCDNEWCEPVTEEEYNKL